MIKEIKISLGLVLVLVGAIIGTTNLDAAKMENPNPARLIIPKIGVDARVLGMGLTGDNKMAVPANYVDAGWFDLGARPGEIGSAVIGAHVDNGGLVNGIFKNLKKLEVGDKLTIKQADGGELTFRVTKIGIYAAEEQNTNEIFFRADKARLNLITCHGKWLPRQNTYSHRLIVFTELAD
jgi:LPXTG-site transpeptidase (sortase) family protein